MASIESLRVLIADDNAHLRSIVSTVLQSFGITQIREAANGPEALEIINTYPVDVALIDYQMEPMDGVELTRQIRGSAHPKKARIPIIMVTGHADRQRVMEARDVGINEIIVKPVTAQAVLSRLEKVIFQPRPFVQAEGYFGPDRRRGSNPGYKGPERRKYSRPVE